ncbi:hypothetical protein Cyrtocomes_01147 [Candidatus Cyrtobacter comes]|uniref:Uncharacterized protein n=1 Tax=Candidatus Cyrtobacter comes TaxID=675776 RepID=A0ABU5L9F0_9RICK|nr:hypothetical protein [Candidatus Cyrtobacter comes]MDZ5762753.1 hypothetical protein [Candidatus Cyrtobacter comes]
MVQRHEIINFKGEILCVFEQLGIKNNHDSDSFPKLSYSHEFDASTIAKPLGLTKDEINKSKDNERKKQGSLHHKLQSIMHA